MDEVGVQSKHRARQFVTKLWVSDCKGNFHLATCLCDNGSEVNLQSNSFLPDDCVFDSPHPVTLEGVSGPSLAGGQRGCYISTHLVAQDLWEDGNVEEVILKDDYFYRADIKYDLYLGHPWLRKNRVAPVGHRRCFLLESGPLERPEFRFLHAGFKSAEEFLKQKVTPKFGEDVTIAEVNGSADYSRELECLRRDLKPVRMDTPPGCRLIVFFCHIKQIKVRRLRRRQSATSRAAHYDSSAQFIKRLYFYEFWVAIFFNHKVLQLCILLCSQVLSCELLRRTLQGS